MLSIKKPPNQRKIINFISFIFYFFSLSMIIMALTRYYSLSTNIADLGFFSSDIFNINKNWQISFSGHFHPIALILSNLYIKLPLNYSPLFLIFIQAISICSCIFIVKKYYGVTVGLFFLFYYPLWVNLLFDFHFDFLVIPILLCFYICCDRKKFMSASIYAALLVFVKEPFCLQVITCGFYIFWLAFKNNQNNQNNQNYLMYCCGFFLVLWGFSWFYITTQLILPYFENTSGGSINSSAFSWMGINIFDKLLFLFTNPVEIFSQIIETPKKFLFLIVVFGLLGFIPLIRPAALIVSLPILMIAMLSNLENYYGYANHYTAGLIVPFIVAFRDGLPLFKSWLSRWINDSFLFYGFLFSFMLLGHWAFASSPISRLFWSDKVWSYSWHAYLPNERDSMLKEAMLLYIPTDINISVTSQNSVNWGHLAHRNVFLIFPFGVDNAHQVMDWSNRDIPGFWQFILTGYKPPILTHSVFSDYVVLDLKRPWFVIDKGCDWIYGSCRNAVVSEQFLNYISKTRQHYELIFEQDGFMIFHRKL